MALPPFNISETLPGDNDIVSQHPPNARTFRDVTESWLLVEHNVNGRHDKVRADWTTDATYPGIASVTTVWASSDDIGDLHKRHGTNAIEWVGVPPGTVTARFDTSVPNGWTACDGTTISRTVAGARLFALWGVTFGVGDGATTFTKPLCAGKVLVGVDAGSVNVAGFTVVGTTAGSKNATIAQAHLPAVNFVNSGITLNDPGHFHFIANADASNTPMSGGSGPTQTLDSSGFGGGDGSTNLSVTTTPADRGLSQTKTTGITISAQGTAASGGSGTGLPLAQVGIAVNYVIKL